MLGIFEKIFSKNAHKNETTEQSSNKSQAEKPETIFTNAQTNDSGITYTVSTEEKEIVSVLLTSILAGSNPDSRFKIKDIVGIDQDKQLAGMMAAMIATGDNPTASYKIISVKDFS